MTTSLNHPPHERARVWLIACLVFAASLCAAVAAGANYTVDVWGTDKGLPEGAVISMIQTRDGYLWLGTLAGLARFDGVHFKVFDENNTPGLNSGQIVQLFEDSKGNLWIGTQSAGAAMVKEGRISSLDIGRGSAAGRLRSVCEDANGQIWMYTADGKLCRYRNGSVDVWKTGGPSTNSCRVLAAEPSGILWVGADQSLHALRPPVTGTALAVEQELHVSKLDYVLASKRGGIWRLADGRIQRWTSNGSADDYPYPWPGGTRVTSACEDSDGNLVVGTLKEGLFWFDSAGQAACITTNSTGTGLSNPSVLSLYMDREGDLWAGTDGGGVDRIRKQVFQPLPESRGLTVQSVCEDSGGRLWLGWNEIDADAGGAGIWTNHVLRRFGDKEGLLVPAVRSVFEDRQSRLWIGTLNGLFQRQQDDSFTLVLPAAVSSIYEDQTGALWFGLPLGVPGGIPPGLARLADRDISMYTRRNGLSTNDVSAIAGDSHGDLWIGTHSGGLNRLLGTNFAAFHTSDGLPSENISSLCADPDGTLWVGTVSSGLARLRDGKWTRYSTRDGLASNRIGYLLEDDQGCLWVGSNVGLMRVQKSALNDFAAGRITVVPCRTYGKADGLPDNECTAGSQPAACRSHDGRLWFPTASGLASVAPAQLRANTNPPPVLIESILVDGQEQGAEGLGVKVPQIVSIPAGKERLEIQYTSLNLADPEKARFKYRLENHETAWTEVGGNIRSAVYSKLPDGNFRFQVIACNEDGVWNEQGATLAVTVLPPFWRKWWFVTSVSLGTLLVLVGSVYYVSTQQLHRQLEGMRQQQALEKERARIARDIHDQVGASLTQVSLLGEMVESDKDDPNEVEEHGRQISQTARETSRALDEIVWTVNPSNDTLDGLINYVCKYAQEYLAVAGLRYRLDAPPQLPATPISPEVRHNVFLASKESITNIVKHARATSASIRLRLDPGVFTLEIQDDGRGPGGVDAKAAQSRNGVRNMRKRLEDIGGTFTIGPAPERGTLVRMTVPVGNSRNAS